MSDALKPLGCPLCGEPLAKLADHPDHFHPFTECYLEGTRVTPKQVAAWNRRAGEEALVEALEGRVVRYASYVGGDITDPRGIVSFEDCVAFSDPAKYEAWIKTPDGIAWLDRREAYLAAHRSKT